MALNDDAVFTAAKGYIYVSTVDAPAPTEQQIFDFVDETSLVNEVQRVAITGSPTGGTFTLTFAGQTTAGIAFNANAAAVQSALEALSNIAPGDVVVTGGALPATAVTVKFQGVYTGTDAALMTANAASLTGGASPAVNVTVDSHGWSIIGHTSRDDLPEFGYDGGGTEARGTWQNEALRTVVTEAAIDFVTFNLVQFDKATLELYYGAANVATEANSYALNGSPGGATQRSFLIVIVDGENKIAFHASKSDLRREDAIALAVDEFGALPMRATFLKSSGKPLFSWVPGVDTP